MDHRQAIGRSARRVAMARRRTPSPRPAQWRLAILKIAKRVRAGYHIADRLLAEVDLEVLAGWNGHSPERGDEPARLAGGDADHHPAGCHYPGEHLAQRQLESMIDIRRDHAANGKRRRDRVMGLRWVRQPRQGPQQFHPINEHLHPSSAAAALEAISSKGAPHGGSLGLGWPTLLSSARSGALCLR